ncbi:MAG: hypothetical protein EOO77_16820 [Oxalobacteraceae bacterium]|nr:MAG: hypothetical protein EOO77_16820 [Oxalobacteraceae bacterium]
MLSTVSSSNLLTTVRPTLLKKAASLMPEEDKSGTDKKVPALLAAKAKAGANKTDGGDEPSSKSTEQRQTKTIVDQRTTDTGSMRITVISYSDGSSDTLQQVKNTDQSVSASSKKSASLSDKGLMIDRTA